MQLRWALAFVVLIWPQRAVAQSLAKSLHLTQEIRIGANDGGAGELHGFPRLALASNGDVYVFSGCEIDHYDRRGKYVERVARCGDGPGEFRSIAAIGFLHDTLWASDRNHRRVTFFAPGQRNASTLPLVYRPVNSTFSPAPPAALLQSGVAVAEGILPWDSRAGISSSRSSSTLKITSPLVRLRRNSTVIDTIAMLLVRSAPDLVVNIHGNWLGTMRQPFNVHSFWAARSDGQGLVLAEVLPPSAASAFHFTVRMFDGSGKEIFSTSRSYVPLPIAARTRDSVMNATVTQLLPSNDATAAKAMLADVREQIRTQMIVPKYESPISQILIGNDGSIWIRREDRAADGPAWDVLDRRGQLFGHLHSPPGLRLAYADLQQVLAVETDSDSIPWIVRLRVTR